jgi:hypothetical protein
LRSTSIPTCFIRSIKAWLVNKASSCARKRSTIGAGVGAGA